MLFFRKLSTDPVSFRMPSGDQDPTLEPMEVNPDMVPDTDTAMAQDMAIPMESEPELATVTVSEATPATVVTALVVTALVD
jgi:hypothetical protein